MGQHVGAAQAGSGRRHGKINDLGGWSLTIHRLKKERIRLEEGGKEGQLKLPRIGSFTFSPLKAAPEARSGWNPKGSLVGPQG